MADHGPHHPSVDEALDRAVREMMDVDPRPGFEQRVMRRLTESPAPRCVWPRLVGAAAVLAAIVVAALLLRGTADPRTAPSSAPVVATDSPRPAPEVPPVPTATDERPSTVTMDGGRRRAARHTRSREVVVAAGTASSREEDAAISTITALQAPMALALDDIQQPPVNMTDITMSTIEIPRLHVEALGPVDGPSRE